MIVLNISLRDMESLLKVLKTPWDGEHVPDHSTIGNHLDTIDEDWLQLILTKTAQMCMETAGGRQAPPFRTAAAWSWTGMRPS